MAGTTFRRAGAPLIVALVAVLGTVDVVRADWLVFRDGSRLETSGPWRAQGKLLVFEQTDGALVSVRAEEIDLEASRALTKAALAAETAQVDDAQPARRPAKEEVKRRASIVITDADVAHVDPRQFETDTSSGADSESEGAEPASEPASSLAVTKWGRVSEEGASGTLIIGTLRNSGDRVTAGITLNVRALGSDGTVLADQPAAVDSTTLMPGHATRFEARLQDVLIYSTLEFNATSTELDSSPGDAEPGAG